jgi:NAD(P)-dependent dehydrogenase (short-subunit alcohol dehydrogenase family)
VEGTVERFGRLDVLVNCAAVNRRMPILEMDVETYDSIMALDLRLPYFLSQRAARVMKEQGGGAIVNISSLNAAYALEHISVYGPAKAGLSQLTRVMALEWSEDGIRANAIAPGFMDTPLSAPIWADPDRRRWILNRVPVKRPGRPEELVGTCLLLASEAGSFLTGQTLYVDGGALAGGRWFTPDE